MAVGGPQRGRWAIHIVCLCVTPGLCSPMDGVEGGGVGFPGSRWPLRTVVRVGVAARAVGRWAIGAAPRPLGPVHGGNAGWSDRLRCGGVMSSRSSLVGGPIAPRSQRRTLLHDAGAVPGRRWWWGVSWAPPDRGCGGGGGTGCPPIVVVLVVLRCRGRQWVARSLHAISVARLCATRGSVLGIGGVS